jgi:S1-C subfamily serine protease|tara:strand:+ start:278 stop:1207 length:930 start_codon:yes stop_codon:yes gene_type:complete
MDMSNSRDAEGIRNAALSVVNILATNSSQQNTLWNQKQQNLIGSGIIISEDGYILTNLHIIKGKKKIINVELDDRQIFLAKVIGYDERSDLAVIKIDVQEKLSPINIADSTIAKIGDEVIAIGNPFGLGKTFTSGIISATGRDYGNPYLELIQTDAAINPGNSGGALLNQRGNLIGMSTNIFSKTGSYSGIGFALPANKMIEVASEIIKYGTVKRSWIGDFRVRFKRFILNDQLTYGLEILELKEKGPLYEIGHVKQGDIIVKINDNIATWENLTGALNNSFPGDEIELKVLQNSKIKDLTLITMATGN